MPNKEFRLLIITTFIGSLTRQLVKFYKSRKTLKFKSIILSLLIGLTTVIPAYFIKSIFNLDTDMSLLIGYLFGFLSEKLYITLEDKIDDYLSEIIKERM